jgi:eukaryotic-like serine/threonine-protein kinase
MARDSLRSFQGMIADWLSTAAAGAAATLVQAPRTTIIPPGAADTGGRRAIAALEQLGSGAARLSPIETLGQGGMGVVRLAEQVALGRKVAVKTLRTDRRGEDATLELLREAWVTGSLEHPNVVPVYDIGLDESGAPMIVLKRIEGHAWSDLMTDATRVRERFGAEDLLAWNLEILMQVLQAVRFAHSRGILHRDLKPDNVMIGDFGEVYLLDWGIAVSLRDDGSGRLPLAKDAAEMAGTPCYMAPEMLGRDTGVALSERTDIYLAGAMLFELLAGRPPHEGDTALAVVTSVVASSPSFPDDAPAELVRIARTAMDPDPDGRFENAEQLRLALRGYLQRRGSARLAEAAERRLDALIAAVEGPIAGATADPGRRQELYNLFGAARFGFHEALAGWRDNQAARDGLRRSIEVMVDHELAHDDPRAAAALLAELSHPPPALAARVEAAVAAAAAHQRELETFARAHDASIGRRTRTFGTLLLGVGFTIMPLVEAATDERFGPHDNGGWALWSGFLLVLVILFGVWARESMTRTIFNRRVWLTTQLVFVAQLVLYAGAAQLDLDALRASIAMILVWSVITGMASITIDPRLAPTSIGYAAAFLIAARWPATRWWMMSASNLLLTINAVAIWRPPTILMTDAERAALGRPPRKPRARPPT